MSGRIMFGIVQENELDLLLEGKGAEYVDIWRGVSSRKVTKGHFGVFGLENGHSDVVRPVALITTHEDNQRLFTRYAQLRTDLSPISSWCHVVNERQAESMRSAEHPASLDGLEASWAGVVIAEAQALADRDFQKLKLAACLATSSFCVARSRALWPKTSIDETLDRLDVAQSIVKRSETKRSKVRDALRPIWGALGSLRTLRPSDWQLEFVIDGLRSIERARQNGTNETADLRSAFRDADEAKFLSNLQSMSPEDRVSVFDNLVEKLKHTNDRDASRRQMLSFLAGYLASVAAGGTASLGLTTPHRFTYPEISGWALAIAGLGERVTWTSGFDGLGRLISRELLRSFRLDEAPTCDFALDEGAVLIDRQLSDPLVHLKLKQSRIVTVAVLPGVNVMAPLSEGSQAEVESVRRPAPDMQDIMVSFANALWPHLRAKMLNEDDKTDRNAKRPRRKSQARQSKLNI